MAITDPAKLQFLLDLNALVDNMLEKSMSTKRGLAETVLGVLPALCKVTGAHGAFLRSYDEALELRTFHEPLDWDPPTLEPLLKMVGPESTQPVVIGDGEDNLWFAQPLDVAGEWFGSAGILIRKDRAEDLEFLVECVTTVCEQLDNYLFSIRAAREKHKILMELSEALRRRVLAEGLEAAVRVLYRSLNLDRLLLVCVGEEEQATLQVQVYEKGELVVDTMGRLAAPPDVERLRAEARTYLFRGHPALPATFGFEAGAEEVMISGATDAPVVGKILATARAGILNTHDRDILAGFAGFVSQRVVDFHKEWRGLARSFRIEDVSRMLLSGDYAEHYLAPREAEVAILYADISGFTRLSEQVLKTPANVALLVEEWGAQAVQLIWQHGGVFDKMIGDCVIGLFGPPFYEQDEGGRLLAACRCAKAIREMTMALPERGEFRMLREGGLGVSIGVNLAPLFVGSFGPNDNFTGFSAGMNNTARLQGCAERNQILVMADPLARLPAGHGLSFGDELSAKVKNVAEPLRFRAMEVGPAGDRAAGSRGAE